MLNLNINYHYQKINNNIIPNDKKVILESFDNKNFELTIIDKKDLKTINNAKFKNIIDQKDLNNRIYKYLKSEF